jgi:hypothetical protein
VYIPRTYVPIDEPYARQYFAMEPRIQVNKPVLKWLQLNASVGYRFMNLASLYGTNSRNLGGPSLNFSIVFGNFK